MRDGRDGRVGDVLCATSRQDVDVGVLAQNVAHRTGGLVVAQTERVGDDGVAGIRPRSDGSDQPVRLVEDHPGHRQLDTVGGVLQLQGQRILERSNAVTSRAHDRAGDLEDGVDELRLHRSKQRLINDGVSEGALVGTGVDALIRAKRDRKNALPARQAQLLLNLFGQRRGAIHRFLHRVYEGLVLQHRVEPREISLCNSHGNQSLGS